MRGLWRARWWNYYERGRSYQDGGLWEEAIADFETALEMRDAEEWRARTYGLHFVSYFPNRELGVSYYQVKRYQEAKEYLGRSLGSVDTARVHKYLDLVRRAEMAEGRIEDAERPSLSVSPVQGVHYRQVRRIRAPRSVISISPVDLALGNITGTPVPFPILTPHWPFSNLPAALVPMLFASPDPQRAQAQAADTAIFVTTVQSFPIVIESRDNMVVASATVDNKDVYFRNSGQEVRKVEEVQLEEGMNTIKVQAKDLAGNAVETAIQVRLDWEAPSINVYEPPAEFQTQLPTVNIDTLVIDDVGLAAVEFDGTPLLSPDELGVDSAPPAEIAIDYPEYPLERDTLNLLTIWAEDLAGNSNEYDLDVYQGAAMPGGEQGNLRELDPPIGRFVLVNHSLSPSIEFDTPEGLRVFVPEFLVRGRIAAGEDIVSLSVNGQPVAVAPAPRLQWARRVPLEVGDNTVEGIVRTRSGAGAREALSIRRELGYLEKPDSRLKVAFVLGVRPRGQRGGWLEREFEAILNEDGRFDLVSLAEGGIAIDPTDRELTSDLCRRAITIAQRCKAHLLLLGSFVEIEHDLELVVQAVDPASREVLAVADGQTTTAREDELIRFELQGLAKQLRSHFPRLEAPTLSADAIGAGAEAGWRVGMHILIGTPPSATEDFRLMAEARITRVREHASEFKVINGADKTNLRAGLHVVAR